VAVTSPQTTFAHAKRDSDGAYLCGTHASVIREQQPERRFGQIDRSIDRLLVEHLFGGRVCERDSHEHCPRAAAHVAVQQMPWFAESEVEAERVVGQLREDGVDLRFRGVRNVLPRHWQFVFSDPEREPLAICVAALIAKGVEI